MTAARAQPWSPPASRKVRQLSISIAAIAYLSIYGAVLRATGQARQDTEALGVREPASPCEPRTADEPASPASQASRASRGLHSSLRVLYRIVRWAASVPYRFGRGKMKQASLVTSPVDLPTESAEAVMTVVDGDELTGRETVREGAAAPPSCRRSALRRQTSTRRPRPEHGMSRVDGT